MPSARRSSSSTRPTSGCSRNCTSACKVPNAFIPDAESLDRLKRTQAAYFNSLTAGDYGPEYILHRLRVGVTHQRIGLAPKWYIGAYSKYLSGLLPELWRLLHRNPQKFLDTYRALQKLVLLDMGLAIDT